MRFSCLTAECYEKLNLQCIFNILCIYFCYKTFLISINVLTLLYLLFVSRNVSFGYNAANVRSRTMTFYTGLRNG